jgi:hypothetical protein
MSLKIISPEISGSFFFPSTSIISCVHIIGKYVEHIGRENCTSTSTWFQVTCILNPPWKTQIFLNSGFDTPDYPPEHMILHHPSLSYGEQQQDQVSNCVCSPV